MAVGQMSSLYLTKVVPNSVVLRPPNPLESTIDLTPGPGRGGGRGVVVGNFTQDSTAQIY